MRSKFIIVLIQIISLNIITCSTSVPQTLNNVMNKLPVMIKQGDTWYLYENGNKYLFNLDNLNIKFVNNTSQRDIDSILTKYDLNIADIKEKYTYTLNLNPSQNLFEVYFNLINSMKIKSVQFNKSGSPIEDKSPLEEILINNNWILKKNNKWYKKDKKKIFEIIPNSLSLRFKNKINANDKQKFIEVHEFKVVRKNKLDIYDVEISKEKSVINIFLNLYDHPLLDFIELNTIGVY